MEREERENGGTGRDGVSEERGREGGPLRARNRKERRFRAQVEERVQGEDPWGGGWKEGGVGSGRGKI